MAGKEISGIRLIKKFVGDVWPEVDLKLDKYRFMARQIENEVLSQQALSSIHHKKFHALGGSAYALYPGIDISNTIDFIVALQTISDYLDNLCDRSGVEDELAFRELHRSLLDAVDLSKKPSDYYTNYPFKSDNGYLVSLVEDCQKTLSSLPSYFLVEDKIKQLVELYTNLQTYKHLNTNVRESKLTYWADSYKNDQQEIFHWEFSAASGSTLGIFVLFAAAYDPKLTEKEVNLIYTAYFPWISGLHILLDYYIDSNEDQNGGDLNFTQYYNSLEQCRNRLTFFLTVQSKAA